MPLRRRTTAPSGASAEPPDPTPPPTRSRAERASAADADTRARDAGLVETAPTQRTTPFSGPMPRQAPGFERITERVFDLPDPEAEYALLEKALSLGTQEFDSIAKALDSAEDNARRAHRLYVGAKLDYERFLADAEVIEGAIWSEAVAELQREKEAGTRTKQITDADSRAKCAALFPDEWRDLAEKKVQAKLSVEHMERFADLWVSRCRSLGGLLAAKR